MNAHTYDIWKMLAGVAFFLLAMDLMESSLKLLAGRRFKLFLKKQTNNKFKAIGGAAIVTGLLQSSSVVNLMVLSMVGAGVVKMENALGLLLGSNLGTTFDSWFVAIFGFNYDIENIILPLAAITGIGMFFLNSSSKWHIWLKFLFSISFLFVALGFIKTGMEGYVKQTDLSQFNQYPNLVFLIVGVFLTAIIQSSSATIVLTLSALHSNAITLYAAMAIVLGSEIGTTFKLFLAAAKGISAKKRIALANFLFNLIAVIIMYILLKPAYNLITNLLGIKNHLIALVFFQTFLNMCAIILFFPFLTVFGKYLTRKFHQNSLEGSFIDKGIFKTTDEAFTALKKETIQFLHYVLEYSLASFEIEVGKKHITKSEFSEKSIDEQYEFIKQSHGHLHGFCLNLQNSITNKMDIEKLEKIITANRNLIYGAKNIRDAQLDITQFRNSSNDIKYNFYLNSRTKLEGFSKQIYSLLALDNSQNRFDELAKIYQETSNGYQETVQLLYKENLANNVNEVEISTLINFNRELYTSFKSIVFGLKDMLLEPKEASYFDKLPGFIR